MASKFLSLLSLLTLTSSGLAGVTTYTYNPYAAYHHFPAASVTTYASPAHQVVYQHAAPTVYQHSPVFTRSYVAPASVVAAAPAVKTVAAPAVYHHTPTITKSYVAPAPVVKTVAAAPAAYVAAASSPVLTKTIFTAAAPAPAPVKQVEIESHPQYDFSYGVHDSLTGDIKSQVESRSGGNVAGSYSVVDADGYKRTVTYTADDLNGFNAVVQREPIAPIVARVAAVAAPSALVQPVQQVVAAQHVVPVQQVAAAQPVVSVQQQQQQQQIQYLPQQQEQQINVAQPAEQQPEQPAIEPVPVEYPEQQSEHEQHQQQPVQPQYPQEQNFPPFQHAEGDDTDVVDLRSTNNAEPSNANAPAPVAEA